MRRGMGSRAVNEWMMSATVTMNKIIAENRKTIDCTYEFNGLPWFREKDGQTDPRYLYVVWK